MDNNRLNKNKEEERELLQRVASGDESSFAQIVDRYTNVVYPYLLHWLKQAEKAEEVTQDVFMRVWNNRQKLAGMENFPGYIYVITRNRANSALKEKLLRVEEINADKLQDLVSRVEFRPEHKELAKIVDQAVDALPPRRREVFVLSRREDLSYDEIAERLNISRSAVRQHIVEALVFLRHYLKEHAGIVVSLFSFPGLLVT